MTKTGITPIELIDTFQTWVDKTNEVIDILNENAVLASPGESFTTIGNATIDGSISANTLIGQSVSSQSVLTDTIEHVSDVETPIVINSPIKILSPSNIESMLEIQTNAGEKPIVGLINGSGARWNLSLESSTATSRFMVSTLGAAEPQLKLSQDGRLLVLERVIAAEFQGDGSRLTALDANNISNLTADKITSGTLPSGVLPTIIIGQKTFRAPEGARFEQASANDSVLIRGRAGGASNYAVTITPAALSANRTLTLANGNTTLVAGTMVPTSYVLTTSGGLTGGGDLSVGRTIELTGQSRALHVLATNGLIARTAANTVASRTIQSASDTLVVTNGNGVSGNPSLQVVISSESVARAGTTNSSLMTPLRTKQAIETLSLNLISSESAAVAGTYNESIMSPLRTRQAIDSDKHTSAEQIPFANGRYTFPNPFGTKPSHIVVIFRCVEEDAGYVPNDEIYVYPGSFDPNSGNAVSAIANNSAIYVANYLVYAPTETFWTQITFSKWRIKIKMIK